jgi:plasmid stabilization system protein ParE
MKTIIRVAAHADIERIYDWIAQDSPHNARSVVDRIYDAIENNLAFSPYIGHREGLPVLTSGSCAGCPTSSFTISITSLMN